VSGPGSRPRVVLVGPMGAGKSTVADLLGQRWGLGVRDTDRDVEETAGKSVSEIFVDDGEEHFRALERAAVAAALDGHRGVLALGGGAVLDASTREALRDHFVVFLEVGLADTIKRVGLGAGIKALLDERLPIYEEVATFTAHTDGRTAEEVAEEVAMQVEKGQP
jgi:shikimate kinase